MSETPNKKVLVIEDDAMLSSILMRHLAEQNIDARLINTGDKAFEQLKEDIPKVLVLDLYLPVTSGIEILKMIRNDPTTKDIMVLVVTNSNENEHRELVTQLGGTYIVKASITPTNIIDRIKKLLE